MKHTMTKLIAWDSPTAAGRFILGVFLLVGLFPWIRYGAEQLLFLARAGVNPPVIKIDLRKKNFSIPKTGWIEVTGYAGEAVARDTAPTLHDFRTVREYYYSLVSPGDQDESPAARIVVRHDQAKVGRFWFYPQGGQAEGLPEPNRLVTIRGIIGQHIGAPPKNLRYDLNPPLSPDARLLAAGAEPPILPRLLAWFIPSLTGFCFGLYLVLHWLRLLRSQFFGKK